MKKLTALLLIFSFTAIAQQSTYKQRILVDEFVDNRFEWVLPETSFLNKIRDGFLFYSNPYEFLYFDGKAVYYDQNKDFEIESKIKFISGDVDKFNGIFWGDLIFGNKFFFGFSSLGYIKIVRYKGFEEQELINEKLDVVNKTDFNVLKVQKVNNRYIFYINGVKVFETKFVPTGNYIGFGIAPKSYIQIAYLRSYYL